MSGMKYKILEADSANALEAKVKKSISEGWTPQGGIAIGGSESVSFRFLTYAQAVIFVKATTIVCPVDVG